MRNPHHAPGGPVPVLRALLGVAVIFLAVTLVVKGIEHARDAGWWDALDRTEEVAPIVIRPASCRYVDVQAALAAARPGYVVELVACTEAELTGLRQ